jgi:cytochrome c-type biogenesis protein CcmF
MYASLAQLGLILSVFLAASVPVGFLWFKKFSILKLKIMLDNIILIQFIFISFAFISLSYAYITSDFSIVNVFNNSHIAIPLIYKFSGLWSNHEGSMILWLFFLATVNLIANQHKLIDQEKIWISATQIIITASLIAYTLIKSNPFIILSPTPLQGDGFNPLLQDIGLAIHPPILYIGYVTSVIAFALSLAALMIKKISPELLQVMQKWTLFSWCFLSLGIALGSWWAYRELGWGGYWFWDPVENASLLPWLTSCALIHSIYATKKLDTNYKWTILLAIFTFLLSILATFFVRSGAVTSVHSFANDSNRGIFILSLLSAYSLISLGTFALRGHYLESTKGHSLISRFGGINLANILWTFATLTILISLLYPLLIKVYNGSQVSVNANFFESSFIPLLLAILILMALTLPASWQKILFIHYRDFFYSIISAILITIIFYCFSLQKPSIVSSIAFFAGSIVTIRMLLWFAQKLSTNISYKFYLILLVHIAAGLFAMIIAFIETNSQEVTLQIKEGDKVKFANFDINYAKRENIAIDNYLAGKVILYIEKNNEELAILSPEVRYYPVEKSQTSESSIYHYYFYDIYAVINEITKDGNVSVKLYFKPLITWLWIICAIVFGCGILLFLNIGNRKNEAKA